MSTIKTKGRSLGDFGQLTVAEQKLLDHCRDGQQLVLNLNRPRVPHPIQTIRAGFLRFLILGGDQDIAVHERGIRLRGAYVQGSLDLQNANTCAPFDLSHCTFDQPLILSDATLRGPINLDECRMPSMVAPRCLIHGSLNLSRTLIDDGNAKGLSAPGARISGDVSFDNIQVTGSLDLGGVEIKGGFACVASLLHGGEKYALNLTNAVIESDISLVNSRLEGGQRCIVCLNATIGGDFSLDGATLISHSGPALDFFGSHVKQNFSMLHNATANGQVHLANAQVDGMFALAGSFDGRGEPAVEAYGATLRQGVFLIRDFNAKGPVVFNKAQINDRAVLAGRFEAVGEAICFDGAHIDGNLDLSNADITGEVRLITTRISQQLVCRGTRILAANGQALSADAAVVGRDVRLSDGFSAQGTVRLLCTRLEGDLICHDARFESPNNGRSLTLSQSTILGKVVLKIKADSSVVFNDATIEGALRCRGSEFTVQGPLSLSLEGARIKGTLDLRKLVEPLHDASLANAHAARLHDDLTSWGKRIVLNGFKYDTLAAKQSLGTRHRLDWLRSQVAGLTAQRTTQKPQHPNWFQRLKYLLAKCTGRKKLANQPTPENFRPQPWWHLKNVLEDMAHFSEAREIGIALENEKRKLGLVGQTDPASKRRRRDSVSRTLTRFLHWAYGFFTGYGYRPIRLLYWFVGTWIVCGAIYWYAALLGIFAPSDPLIYQNPAYQVCQPDGLETWSLRNPDVSVAGKGNWYLCEKLPAEYSGFSPLAYSLDVLMPFVDLKQESDWAPRVPTPNKNWVVEYRSHSAEHGVRLLIWVQTLFGWAIGLLVVAIVSGLARKTE